MEQSNFNRQVNLSRFHGQAQGHYESYFLRANHPSRPLAFWIRYTIFSPKGQPGKAIGELWAIFFNGETNRHAADKQEYPMAACHFDTSIFEVRVGPATLTPDRCQGSIAGKKHTLDWELAYAGNSDPVLLLPLNLYQGKFPAAKSLVSLPMAKFNGEIKVDGELIQVENWVGSQNHNWGSKHTDLYAWGQVAGFDTDPESFLEAATARLKLGSLWMPPLTLLVLRHQQKEYQLNGLFQGLRAQGKFGYFNWEFRSRSEEVEIEGQILAPGQAFVGLNYYNPPGGSKHCLNSKVAACKIQIKDLAAGTTRVLETRHRAAFEILTGDRNHGIEISA